MIPVNPNLGAVQYRVLRRVLPLPTVGSDVKISAHWNVDWIHGSNERDHLRFLVVSGMLMEKGTSYAVEWSFPIVRESAQAIQAAIFALAETTQEFQSGHQPPLEKDIFIYPVSWMRLGVQYKNGKFDRCYIELSKDGTALRAHVETLPALASLTEMVS